MKTYNLERVKDNTNGKWFLVRKADKGIIASNFDKIGLWSSFSSIKGHEHDIYGWDGLIFLDEPVKSEGAYPYSVRARVYHYTCDGEIISITNQTVGISGID
jgi:hypothetical protein